MNDENKGEDLNEQEEMLDEELEATEEATVQDGSDEWVGEDSEREPQYAQAINPDIQLELDRFGRHVDSLTETVLESADLANRSAMATTGIAEDFKESIGAWNEVNSQNILYLKVLVIVGGIVMLLSSVLFTVSALRLGSRVSELDSMMMAVGKRVVELNSSAQDLADVQSRIDMLNTKQEAIVTAQDKLAKEVRDSMAQTSEMLTQLPGQAAKQVAMTSSGVGKQVEALAMSLDAQGKSVKDLSTSVEALKGSIGNVNNLKRQVEAMVKLEKERYLETMQRAAMAQQAQQAQPKPQPKPLAFPPVKMQE